MTDRKDNDNNTECLCSAKNRCVFAHVIVVSGQVQDRSLLRNEGLEKCVVQCYTCMLERGLQRLGWYSDGGLLEEAAFETTLERWKPCAPTPGVR